MFFIELIDQSAENVKLRFTIEDTGIGIPEKFINTLFDSFSQADNNYSDKHGGTGLGLSIVQGLIEMQGGAIKVESEINVGTTFIAELEYEICSDIDVVKAAEEADVVGIDNIRGANILVAEDNFFNQKLAKKILTDFEVGKLVFANNGKEAVDCLKKEAFDLILMDLRMPEMDGLEATQFIRQELKSNIPILACTAHALKEEVDKCAKAGMNGYITKPFKKEDLAKEISMLLGGTTPSIVVETDEEIGEAPTMESPKLPLDLSLLRDNCDNDEAFIIEMLEVFLHETPAGLKELEKAVNNNQPREVLELFHKMKSQHRLVGAIELYEQMDEMENWLHDNGDFNKISAALPNMKEAILSNIQLVENTIRKMR